MPNGKTLLCVNRGAGEHRWERTAWKITPESIDKWAEMEWIDLRAQNMARWQKRMSAILKEIAALPDPRRDASSQYGRAMTNPATWQLETEIDPKAFLTKLRNNLNILQEREAKYGGNAPLELLNQIGDRSALVAWYTTLLNQSPKNPKR